MSVVVSSGGFRRGFAECRCFCAGAHSSGLRAQAGTGRESGSIAGSRRAGARVRCDFACCQIRCAMAMSRNDLMHQATWFAGMVQGVAGLCHAGSATAGWGWIACVRSRLSVICRFCRPFVPVAPSSSLHPVANRLSLAAPARLSGPCRFATPPEPAR